MHLFGKGHDITDFNCPAVIEYCSAAHLSEYLVLIRAQETEVNLCTAVETWVPDIRPSEPVYHFFLCYYFCIEGVISRLRIHCNPVDQCEADVVAAVRD